MLFEKRLIIWTIIGTGISSVAIQLITIREFLSQFHGNEIIISIVLFTWLMLTGLGSFMARLFKRPSLNLYSLLTLIAAVLPLLHIVLIRALRDRIFVHGLSPGFYETFAYIFATVLPYCILTGFLLPYSLKVINRHQVNLNSGELYITDSIGDIIGGIAFSFFLVYWLQPFKLIAMTSGILILASLLLIAFSRRYLVFLMSLCAVSIFFLYSLDSHFEKSTLYGQYGDIVSYRESPYGRVVVTKEGPQNTFWESGLPIYSDADIMRSEEKIHYPLSQIEDVSNVLLVSGGLGETLDELAKYDPDHADYIELDPTLISLAREFGALTEPPWLNIVNMDARRFIKNTKNRYDAVIIDLPDPDTFQLNRFYTSEFFQMAKAVLKPDGILSFCLEYSPNYISRIRGKKISSVYNTVTQYFRNVVIIPAGDAYFLCSDKRLSMDVPERLGEKSVKTEYVENFFHGNVTPDRIKQLTDILDEMEYANSDFEPRMINIVFKEWFFLHDTSPKAFFIVLLIIAAVYIIFMKREEYVLFSTGLTAMGAEMLVIFTFQVIYGYIYLKIGAIITMFLMGLLPGALIGNLRRQRNITDLVLSETIILALLLIFFIWSSFIKGEPQQLFFLGYCFVFSFFAGFQFPVVVGVIGEKNNPAARCIAADMTGAAIGTLLTGTILIPLLGIQSAIIFLMLIKLSSSAIIIFFGKKRQLT